MSERAAQEESSFRTMACHGVIEASLGDGIMTSVEKREIGARATIMRKGNESMCHKMIWGIWNSRQSSHDDVEGYGKADRLDKSITGRGDNEVKAVQLLLDVCFRDDDLAELETVGFCRHCKCWPQHSSMYAVSLA